MSKAWKVSSQTTIQEVLEKMPSSLPVLMKHFGGCFLCPNVLGESLQSCAEENNIQLDGVLKELKESAS